MALQFNCTECNQIIIVKYLKPGEQAVCTKCGRENTVPADATGTDKDPDYLGAQAVKKSSDIVDVEVPTIQPKPFPGFLQTILLFIYYIGIIIALTIIVTITGKIFGQEVYNNPFVTTSLGTIGWVVVLLIGLAKAKVPTSEMFPLTKFNWTPFILTIIVIMGARALFSGLSGLFLILTPEISQTTQTWFENIMKLYETGFWFVFVFMVIIAPIIEELVFRGLILRGFIKRYKPVNAILYSAILFGIVHGNPILMLWGFILGLLLGWLFYLTRSLVPCILTHAVSNFSAIATYYILVHGQSENGGQASTADIIIISALVITGMIMCTIGIRKLNLMYRTFKAKSILTDNNSDNSREPEYRRDIKVDTIN